MCWIPLHANKHKQRKQESSYRQLEAKTNRWGDRWLYILLRLPQFHNTCIQHTNSSFMSPKHGWYEKLQCLHGMICYGWSGKSCCVNSIKLHGMICYGWSGKSCCVNSVKLHGMICYGWSGKSCCVNSVKLPGMICYGWSGKSGCVNSVKTCNKN